MQRQSSNSYQPKENCPQPTQRKKHPSGATETAPTKDPPAAEEADANPSDTTENATIDIDAQGDTVEDPIIINESTSNSNNDSAGKAEKST